MTSLKDTVVRREIQAYKKYAAELPALRECYQFIKDEPSKTVDILDQMRGGEAQGGFLWTGVSQEPPDMKALERQMKVMSTLGLVKSLIERGRQSLTVENVKANLAEMVFNLEFHMNQCLTKIALELVKELKPFSQPGFDVGFVRKYVEKGTPYKGKAEDIIEAVVNGTLDELVGDGNSFYQVDYSALLDLDNLDKQISPITLEYLKCKAFSEKIRFLEENQELLKAKYLREIFEHCYRLEMKGLHEAVKEFSVALTALKSAIFLKELTGEYFKKHEKMMQCFQEARVYLGQFEKQAVDIRNKYITNFQFPLKALPSPYTFVTDVPNEAESRYSIFMTLTERLRNALKEGTFQAVSKTLKEMSPGGVKNSLTLCAMGGFFYFKASVRPTDFGIMLPAVKRALEKLP